VNLEYFGDALAFVLLKLVSQYLDFPFFIIERRKHLSGRRATYDSNFHNDPKKIPSEEGMIYQSK